MEFLNKAEENLTAAQICFENGLYNACANRAYYAALSADLLIPGCHTFCGTIT